MKVLALIAAMLPLLGSAAMATAHDQPGGAFVLDRGADYKLPPIAKALGWSGQTGVEVRLNRDARVEAATVTRHSEYAALDQACLTSALSSTFKPAQQETPGNPGVAQITCTVGRQNASGIYAGSQWDRATEIPIQVPYEIP